MSDKDSWVDHYEARPGANEIRLADVTETAIYDPMFGDLEVLQHGFMVQRILADLGDATSQQRRAMDKLNPKVRAFLMFDLNFLKEVNDTRGHLEGDRLLISFMKAVKGIIRGGDLYGRMGGDEFGIWMSGVDMPQLKDALAIKRVNGEKHAGVAELIRKKAGEIFGEQVDFGLGISLRTIALGEDPELIWEKMFREADKKMYRHKKRRKALAKSEG